MRLLIAALVMLALVTILGGYGWIVTQKEKE